MRLEQDGFYSGKVRGVNPRKLSTGDLMYGRQPRRGDSHYPNPTANLVSVVRERMIL